MALKCKEKQNNFEHIIQVTREYLRMKTGEVWPKAW